MHRSVESLGPHLTKFSKLRQFPQLEKTYQRFSEKSTWEEVMGLFFQYRLLVKRMTNMSSEDEAMIAQINQPRNKKGADVLRQELGPERWQTMVRTLNQMKDPASELYKGALEELQAMMTNGHLLFKEGKKPQDGDPISDAAIWGFTQIPGEATTAQAHFLVCHFFERFMTQVYRAEGVPMAQHKDYFLRALTDVLMIEYWKYGRFEEIYTLWRTPKAEGGLGWISDERVTAYQGVLKKG